MLAAKLESTYVLNFDDYNQRQKEVLNFEGRQIDQLVTLQNHKPHSNSAILHIKIKPIAMIRTVVQLLLLTVGCLAIHRCMQPVEAGRCYAYFPRFAYNSTTNQCERFVYGGCDANENNFKTKAECEKACKLTHKPGTIIGHNEPTVRDVSICRLPHSFYYPPSVCYIVCRPVPLQPTFYQRDEPVRFA